jgi:hypothetical protein
MQESDTYLAILLPFLDGIRLSPSEAIGTEAIRRGLKGGILRELLQDAGAQAAGAANPLAFVACPIAHLQVAAGAVPMVDLRFGPASAQQEVPCPDQDEGCAKDNQIDHIDPLSGV